MLGLNAVVRYVRNAARAVARHARAVYREYVVEQYVRAGALFGEAIHVHFMGACSNLHVTRSRWERLERQYAELGYRTISIADFIEIGAYGRSSEDLIRVLRQPGEEPVLYSQKFQPTYASGFAFDIDLKHIMTEGQHCGRDHRLDAKGDWESPQN